MSVGSRVVHRAPRYAEELRQEELERIAREIARLDGP
jgi:hypothetical protein